MEYVVSAGLLTRVLQTKNNDDVQIDDIFIAIDAQQSELAALTDIMHADDCEDRQLSDKKRNRFIRFLQNSS